MIWLPASLQFLNLGSLIAGQHFGQDPIDANLFGNRFGSPQVVTRDHHHIQAKLAHLSNSFARSGFDCIGNRHQTNRLGQAFIASRSNCDDHGGLAFRLQAPDILFEGGDVNAFILHHTRVADDDRLAIHVGPNAKTADGRKLLRLKQLQALILGGLDHGTPQRVL